MCDDQNYNLSNHSTQRNLIIDSIFGDLWEKRFDHFHWKLILRLNKKNYNLLFQSGL